jgi:hypothetical protein
MAIAMDRVFSMRTDADLAMNNPIGRCGHKLQGSLGEHIGY